MNKRQYCESRESIAYYSGLNGLEIKGIEYSIDDYIYCVSGAWAVSYTHLTLPTKLEV